MERLVRRNGAPADRQIIEIGENSHGYVLFHECVESTCAGFFRAARELCVPHSPPHAGAVRERRMLAPEEGEVIHCFRRHRAESQGEMSVRPGLFVGLEVHRIISSRLRVLDRGGCVVARGRLPRQLPPLQARTGPIARRRCDGYISELQAGCNRVQTGNPFRGSGQSGQKDCSYINVGKYHVSYIYVGIADRAAPVLPFFPWDPGIFPLTPGWHTNCNMYCYQNWHAGRALPPRQRFGAGSYSGRRRC